MRVELEAALQNGLDIARHHADAVRIVAAQVGLDQVGGDRAASRRVGGAGGANDGAAGPRGQVGGGEDAGIGHGAANAGGAVASRSSLASCSSAMDSGTVLRRRVLFAASQTPCATCFVSASRRARRPYHPVASPPREATTKILQQRTPDGRILLTDQPLRGAKTERSWQVIAPDGRQSGNARSTSRRRPISSASESSARSTTSAAPTTKPTHAPCLPPARARSNGGARRTTTAATTATPAVRLADTFPRLAQPRPSHRRHRRHGSHRHARRGTPRRSRQTIGQPTPHGNR